uniref:Uncharacterized protein n=1 Tax=Arcella intermedia TaxID=1963864 RepID=A0A6B2LLU2_9EUKA
MKKLLLVGDSGTGKSNLLSRYTNNTFHSQYRSTIGVEFSTKTTQVDGKSLKLQIWDTAGQERYRAITGAYYRGASGILLVYDVTSTQSFANLENWHKEIMEHAPEAKLIVVGNKCDTVFDRKITALQGEGLAHQYNAEFIETSAMNDTNVEEAFAKLAASLIHN